MAFTDGSLGYKYIYRVLLRKRYAIWIIPIFRNAPILIDREISSWNLFLNDLNVVLIHFEPFFGVKSLKSLRSNKEGWCEMVFINTR